MRWGPLVLAVLLITTPGCQDVLGVGGENTPTPTGESPTPDRSTPSANDIQSGEIVLSLPELPSAYSFSGRTVKARATVTGDEKESMDRRGIVKIHERVFSLSNRDNHSTMPVFILSSVTIYESTAMASQAEEKFIEAFEADGATVNRTQISAGISAVVIQFTNENDVTNTLVYKRDGALTYYVVTSGGKGTQMEFTGNLFIEMVSDTGE